MFIAEYSLCYLGQKQMVYISGELQPIKMTTTDDMRLICVIVRERCVISFYILIFLKIVTIKLIPSWMLDYVLLCTVRWSLGYFVRIRLFRCGCVFSDTDGVMGKVKVQNTLWELS